MEVHRFDFDLSDINKFNLIDKIWGKIFRRSLQDCLLRREGSWTLKKVEVICEETRRTFLIQFSYDGRSMITIIAEPISASLACLATGKYPPVVSFRHL